METAGETEEVATEIGRMGAAIAQDLKMAEVLLGAFGVQRPSHVGEPQVDPFAKLSVEEETPPEAPGDGDPTDEPAGPPSPAVKGPDVPPPEEQPKLALTGVVLAGESPLAIINDELHELGATVQGLRVAEISEEEVVLMSPKGERLVLPLEGWELGGEN